MKNEIYRIALGISITLLVLSFIAFPIVEVKSAEYYVLIMAVIMNVIFLGFLIILLMVRNRN